MAKRILLAPSPFVVVSSSSKELWVKHLQSTPKAITSNNVHTRVGDGAAGNEVEEVVIESVGERIVDTAWDAAKKTAQTVIETTTAEADTNVVDTVEYRSAEDLNGQLGDGCDNKINF